jgi:hypothetical protein
MTWLAGTTSRLSSLAISAIWAALRLANSRTLATACQVTATVMAISECQLLALDVADFRRLLAAHPDLRDEISRVSGLLYLQTPAEERGPVPHF